MINPSGPKNEVFWYTLKKPFISKLSQNVKADVVIIGGGMAGLTCAQSLHTKGLKVIVLERDFCGAGASGKSSGFITPDSELEISDLLKMYGPQGAKQLWEFVLSGVERIRTNIEQSQIACDYHVQDSLYIANTVKGFANVEEEHAARHALGYKSTLNTKNKLQKILGSNQYAGAVRYPDTFGINAYLYCQGLKETLQGLGVGIYEGTPIVTIDKEGVKTKLFRVKAEYVVLCLDRFAPELGIAKKEIYHAQTFLLASFPLLHDAIKTIFPEKNMMVWDTDLIYQYFRVTGDNRILLGGGDLLYTYARRERHDFQRIVKKLIGYFASKFPHIPIQWEYVWPGMIGVSKDFLPIMGNYPLMPNVYFVGAAAGLPWACALGEYVADKITEGRKEYDEIFSPKRKFFIGRRLQTLLGTPPSFALSHGWIKYVKKYILT